MCIGSSCLTTLAQRQNDFKETSRAYVVEEINTEKEKSRYKMISDSGSRGRWFH